jgi:hypothetical protein
VKTRTLLRLFASALVPVSALANACGDDDNTLLTGTDGGRFDATTGDAAKAADAATADADADAPQPIYDSGGCQWVQRDGGAATVDGSVIEQPDSGLAPISDPGSVEDVDGSYPSEYCCSACGFACQFTTFCKPAPNGKLWCLSCGFGRRPEGFRAVVRFDGDVGTTFAEMARLEAASVVAFRTLARELAFHRAPRRLVRAAERAARDEIRHARAMSALARRLGADAMIDDIASPPLRDLETIAKENAIEGCVHETWGALLAHHQAMTEKYPIVRAVMMRIARDETQHAALAWQIAAWAKGRLDRNARERIAKARREASRRILTSAEGAHRELVARLDAQLWSRAA